MIKRVKRLKILLFTAGFPPPFVGGSVEYIYNLVSNMPAESMIIHTSNMFSKGAKKSDKSFDQKVRRSFFINHVQRHLVNEGEKTSRIIQKLQNLREYIFWPFFGFWLVLCERPNVIQIGEHNIAGVSALLARWILGIPYVYFTYAEEVTMLSKRPLHNRLFLALLRNSSMIISVCDYTRNLLLGKGINPDSIITILPAVSNRKSHMISHEEKEKIRNKYDLINCKVLLTVGSLEERKGHSSVIRSLIEIKKSFPDIKYIIVGEGPKEEELKNLSVELGLLRQIIFTGGVNDDELNCLYEICDLFVMPHRQIKDSLNTEGCPTVFLEASAHGKAVVGGNAGGVADAIINGETGYIVNGEDEQCLTNRIIELLEDKSLAFKMGLAGRSYVSTLTPQKNAEKVWEIYQKLCGG